MVMQRWDPAQQLRMMDELFNRLWRGSGGTVSPDGSESWGIPLDVLEEGDRIVVRASLPGVRPEEIDVTMEDGVLAIRAESTAEVEREGTNYLMRERRTGSFYRSLRLPDTVDQDKAETRYEDGIVSIAFPKLEAKKPKKLSISRG